MRRAIFVFLSLLVALSMVAIPTDTISAKPASSPQLSPPSPAQQLTEDELIEEIYDELDNARGLTDDRDIKKQIAGIKKGVEAVEDLRRAGDKEGALNLKYAIAERLEVFINQLPVASPSLTNLAAATPAANPLYDEMVNIRGKIGMLIEIEEREIPREKQPPPPTIERPPEMEKLIVYSAKFLCGPALGKEGVQPGSYSTAINIHNPNNGPVYLYKKAVIAKREDEPRGKISDFRRVILQADEAIEVDCIDIISLLGPEQEVELTAPSQQTQTILQTTAVSPVSSLIRFIKGFVVIYSTAPLDVVAVYTASTSVGFGLDVEYLSQSRVSTIPYTPPPEEEACPTGCVCSTEKAAIERGYTTLCQDAPCGRDDQQNLMYCWKPAEEAECPQGCVCLYKEDAYKRYGQNATLCQDKPCSYDEQQNPLYCWKPAEEAVCPQECACRTEAEAKEQGLVLCQGQKIVCAYDDNQRPTKYCFEKPTAVGRPSLTLSPAYAENTVGDSHKVVAKVTKNGSPVTGVEVEFKLLEPDSVHSNKLGVLTRTTDASGQATGFNYTGDKEGKDVIIASATVDGYDLEAQATKAWISKPTEVQCPQGCACRTEAEAKRLGLTWCQGQKTVCEYDAAGNATKYCFEEPTSQPTTPPKVSWQANCSPSARTVTAVTGAVLTVYITAQDPTNGQAKIVRVVAAVDGTIAHDSGSISTINYSKSFSLNVSTGSHSIEVKATNANGQTSVVPGTVTCR